MYGGGDLGLRVAGVLHHFSQLLYGLAQLGLGGLVRLEHPGPGRLRDRGPDKSRNQYDDDEKQTPPRNLSPRPVIVGQ